ncbi:GTP 3',8-cyclase MoaA [Luminiphilus sp.]|nr:GTP 3',8-cyclase MoaA [Luminiphilus sp.]
MAEKTPTQLIDSFDRRIDYVRLSVTDRCDFRCTYCMAEEMTFLPRSKVLSLEEIARIAGVFVQLGVAKLRVTGGEPLVRRDVTTLFQQLGALLDNKGLKELAVTTNGSQLVRFAPALRAAGVSTLNISLDTLNPDRFRALTRTGTLAHVIAGIDAALEQNFPRIRLNAVVLRGNNEDDVLPLLDFALNRGLDIAFIEEMPLGQVNMAGKPLEFLPSDTILSGVEQHHNLESEGAPDHSGPARYWRVDGSSTRMGLISPHSNNFCGSCNRLRVTAEGQLLLCLGNEHSISLRDLLRDGASDIELSNAIVTALNDKPKQHVFDQPDQPQIMRFMNASGG